MVLISTMAHLAASLGLLLNALDSHSPLTFEFLLVPILLLFLAILQPGASMTLQHPVPAAEVSRAESAVSHDALSSIFAVFEIAPDLFGCAAADWQGHVEGTFAGDGVVGECGARREMLAGVDEAELGFGQVGAESEK